MLCVARVGPVAAFSLQKKLLLRKAAAPEAEAGA
jgi:hypothetical protein